MKSYFFVLAQLTLVTAVYDFAYRAGYQTDRERGRGRGRYPRKMSLSITIPSFSYNMLSEKRP
ncbi:MAG: hypothetical protein DRI24_20570 [Deltaproteobacteria bacterium]|nr:MAG: hypothetical protein DRI24_20570 [Deltaproteobacteria bacterium]